MTDRKIDADASWRQDGVVGCKIRVSSLAGSREFQKAAEKAAKTVLRALS